MAAFCCFLPYFLELLMLVLMEPGHVAPAGPMRGGRRAVKKKALAEDFGEFPGCQDWVYFESVEWCTVPSRIQFSTILRRWWCPSSRKLLINLARPAESTCSRVRYTTPRIQITRSPGTSQQPNSQPPRSAAARTAA